MEWSTSTYHSLLRVSSLIVAVILVFVSGIWSQATADLALHTENYLANVVGVSVGVAPTELNQITAALTEREQQLAGREDAIAQREIDLGLASGERNNDQTMTFILATVLFILLVLIVLNYALDYIRSREMKMAA